MPPTSSPAATASRRVVALIPARAGSKRVAGKNIKRLGPHPLIAYTIAAARASGIFDRIIVSTDDEGYAVIARHYGADVPFLRPAAFAGDTSPDIEWVTHAFESLAAQGLEFDAFSILRPTSPFRQPETIQRAWGVFVEDGEADSLRAVELTSQHPGKMWIVNGRRMRPLMTEESGAVPWHSSQYAALPTVYVQNASLEMAWARVVTSARSIAGDTVMPFMTKGYEGFDVNTADDWYLAERAVHDRSAALPLVEAPPWLA